MQEEGQKLQRLAHSSKQQSEPGGQARDRESQEATQDQDEKMAKRPKPRTRDSLFSIPESVDNVKGNTIETSREFTCEWKQGALYELIKGRFYFAAHPDDEYTLAAIRHFPERFYFSNHLPGMFAAHAPVLGLRLPLPAACDHEACMRTRTHLLFAGGRWPGQSDF